MGCNSQMCWSKSRQEKFPVPCKKNRAISHPDELFNDARNIALNPSEHGH